MRRTFLLIISLLSQLGLPAGHAGAETTLIGNAPGSISQLLVNRDRQVACSYGIVGGSFLVGGPGLSVAQTISLPSSYGTSTFDFSNWGIAVEAAYNGYYTPSGIFAAPIGASSFLDLQTSATDQSTPSVNDSGDVVWNERDTIETDWNKLYVWNSVQGLSQLDNPPGTDVYPVGAAYEDSGKIVAFIQNQSTTPYLSYVDRYDGSSWSATAIDYPMPSGLDMTVNSSGTAVFDAQYFDAALGEDLYTTEVNNGAQTTRLVSYSVGNGERAIVKIADDGSILTLAPQSGTINWLCSLRNPNGTTIDLQSLVPAGQAQPALPQDSINYLGQVEFETVDLSSGLYSYYEYNAGVVTPIVTDVSQLADPALADNGWLYFYQIGNVYAITSPVPEPAMICSLTATSFIALSRRPRRRMS
jgi:hypothetical protein